MPHGCHAGLQQEACDEVYFARIKRRDENYSSRKLGVFGSDLGAVACFFEIPWSRVSPALTEADQAWLLNEAAFRLRALGRLTEALEPMRAGLPIELKREDWKNAAARASNLSELELTLGAVAEAAGDAERSVTYADRSGDAFLRMAFRTAHADALHQAGRRAEAEARFREAEQMQAERQPAYPRLYSLQGFQYCDLLLAAPERAAWQSVAFRSAKEAPERGFRGAKGDTDERLGGSLALPDALAACRAVSQRAAKIFEWRKLPRWNPAQDSLLDIALDNLTPGRAALYEAILGQSQISNSKSEIEHAVSGLRRAGQQIMLPHALLPRAWQRFLSGARTGPESAQSDLDEAWEIAARGPMKLHLADIHLHRARLFGTPHPIAPHRGAEQAKYPWDSPAADLAAAEQLINDFGYHRRDEEFADAKTALGIP